MSRLDNPDAPLFQRLLPVLENILAAFERHLVEHNTSGGPFDRYSGVIAESAQSLLAALKEEEIEDEN